MTWKRGTGPAGIVDRTAPAVLSPFFCVGFVIFESIGFQLTRIAVICRNTRRNFAPAVIYGPEATGLCKHPKHSIF
ncbi:hypothetical protein [Paracidovorax oryzae]|uniref:hypothetical protein n=1 Tax=Paracidovorax oryzae TaxID=862720 RepID=UPI0035D0576A